DGDSPVVVGQESRTEEAAFRELRISRVGRKARLLGTVETIAPGTVPPRVELPPPGHSSLNEDQYRVMCKRFPGIDIVAMEKQFVAWNSEKGTTPENYWSAYYVFFKGKVKRKG